MTARPKAVLIYPPLTDPTSGYHSLSYLDSFARSRGYPAADMIDANIEAFHHSFSPAGVAWLREALTAAPASDPLAHYDDVSWQVEALRTGEPDPAGVRDAVAVLRDPERFYRYDHYARAVEQVLAWMNCLAGTGFPGQFTNGFQLRMPPAVALGSVAALRDEAVLDRLARPFQPYVEGVLIPQLVAGDYDVVGLNITYQAQLPFALWLARLIRRALPGVFLVAGGTEASDVWKYLRDKTQMFAVFENFDAVVVGEGETAWVEILDSVSAGTIPSSHPNIRLHPRYRAMNLLPVRYEPIRGLPTPDYSRLPWDKYLSPERFVYYSPTRGCYWNRCTFCDYGLNTDGPTSPWRQDTVESIVTDVAELSKFAKFIYFSVDVLAPATILRFAERVLETGIDVRWGAEIRLEKYWSDERCETLRRAGCVAVSVGFESGNQRVLDLIDKGTRPDRVRQTITSMTKADIGVQMMGFTGFPTETAAEGRESIDFLLDNRDLWTFGGLGQFMLTSGSIVARRPDRFGVTDIRPLPGSDIQRVLLYDEPISEAARAELSVAAARAFEMPHARPWLSSVDTPHSFFYHDRFGVSVRDALDRDLTVRDDDEDRAFVVNGLFTDRPDETVVDRLTTTYQLTYGAPIPPDRLLFRRIDGQITPLPRSYKPILNLFQQPTTLRAAHAQLWMLDSAAARKVWQTLISRRLIRRLPEFPDRPVPDETTTQGGENNDFDDDQGTPAQDRRA
ncbi:B12-binding domain-containing radical SAM protein [Actinoplanes regularis]|uniref:Radical SAM superfamily enzyme YgiQ, UPF0313 family n=1 Tax=Actinoplanes regularis TaxID=52697 RepID=A0A239HE49_9ACTN|nr:radical SAM protein [Actinoplanes regularis]GIE91015.1 hypothetical protein Are01nite_74950 [Actinoplanes regularis]SNS79572.1 Radical SAM superfamily enzyme YgiQ, UPF0313 family [Actinoplanes regularis]